MSAWRSCSPQKANDVLEALYRAEVRGVSMSRVQGHGGELDRVETYRGTTVQMGLSDKVRFEIAVSDAFVEPTIEALCEGGRTGEVGDGKIFVVPLERVVRIRTGETDTRRHAGGRMTPEDRHGRHRLDARRDGAGAPDDAGAGPLLRGLVRAKNTLNTFMMCIAALGVATVTWASSATRSPSTRATASSAASTTRS